MNASDLAPTYDLAVIGGGPAGLAAASLAARAGLSTVLFDENPGVGGQIYRAITSTPVTDRTILGEDYWAGAELAAEAKASGASIVTGATVWSLDPQRIVGVSIGGKARMIAARRVIIATGSQERPFPVPGWTLPGVMTAGGAQTMLKAQGLLPAGRTVIAGTGPLLWLLAAQILRAGGKIEAIVDTTPRGNWLRALLHLPDFVLSPYFAKGLKLMREVCARASCPTSTSPLPPALGTHGMNASSVSSPCSMSISAVPCPASPWRGMGRASRAARRRQSGAASPPLPPCVRSSPKRRCP